MVRRFLVVPLLAPWLLVLLVAALNPRPQVSLRLLIWTSPTLPIGTWLAVVSSTGAVLSLSVSALALQGRGSGAGSRPGEGRFGAARRVRRWVQDDRGPSAEGWSEAAPPPPPAAGPRRGPGEPPPTVSVPFRVIRRGTATAAPSPAGSRASAPTATAAAGDGWDDRSHDDW